MESLRTIKAVKLASDTTLHVRWAGAGAVDLDLRDLLKKQALKFLRGANFNKAQLGEWGHSVEWPGGVELGADELWRRTLKAGGPRRCLDVPGLAHAPRLVALGSGRSARPFAPHDCLLFQRGETRAAHGPVGVRGMGAHCGGSLSLSICDVVTRAAFGRKAITTSKNLLAEWSRA